MDLIGNLSGTLREIAAQLPAELAEKVQPLIDDAISKETALVQQVTSWAAQIEAQTANDFVGPLIAESREWRKRIDLIFSTTAAIAKAAASVQQS